MNALLMCLGNNGAKGKESAGGSPGASVAGEGEKSDDRFAGPTLPTNDGVLFAGPVQNRALYSTPFDSSVYIPKYNPAVGRALSNPDFRKKVDPSKLLQPANTTPQYTPKVAQYPQQLLTPQPDLNNNFYVLPPPPPLAGTPSPPLQTYSPEQQSPPPFAQDMDQLPSLSKLLNYCTKTR
mmetsp:Transcript_12828/g.19707  ORF Transcript_12828/g.19707 Transcript_12828/m.19707 type:complete len:180 (-) Transcript_12828:93-632(-)